MKDKIFRCTIPTLLVHKHDGSENRVFSQLASFSISSMALGFLSASASTSNDW